MSEETTRLALPGARRGRALEDTLAKIMPFLRQAGITRVAVVSGLDTSTVPTVMVVRPLSMSLSVTQGKGLTLVAAKVSGIMEAIEHHHAESVHGRIKLASEVELGNAAVSGMCLASRSPLYTADRRILWQAGEGLVSGRERWVPFDAVHLDLRLDGLAQGPSFIPSSNGLASGNTREEATVHAICELIERHLVAEFYELPVLEQESRRLANHAISDADCRRLLDSQAEVGIHAAIWDLTNELEVPCFFCELLGEADELRPIPAARGFGCHAESGVALARAITEAAQSRLTSITGSRDDILPQSELERNVRISLSRQQWQARLAQPAERLFRRIPTRPFGSFADERSWLCSRLLALGFDEPVLVDLSKPDWPIHVVRVIVPGLRFEPTEGHKPEANPANPQ